MAYRKAGPAGYPVERDYMTAALQYGGMTVPLLTDADAIRLVQRCNALRAIVRDANPSRASPWDAIAIARRGPVVTFAPRRDYPTAGPIMALDGRPIDLDAIRAANTAADAARTDDMLRAAGIDPDAPLDLDSPETT